ncbi:Uncharacterized protein QTN25_005281 [Entamoeba marina]
MKTPFRCEMLCKLVSLSIKNDANVIDKESAFTLLQKAIKDANRVIDGEDNVKCLVTILNYLIYNNKDIEQIQPDLLNHILKEITSSIEEGGSEIKIYFNNTTEGIKQLSSTNAKLSGISF